jgi:hypothetical protein
MRIGTPAVEAEEESQLTPHLQRFPRQSRVAGGFCAKITASVTAPGFAG